MKVLKLFAFLIESGELFHIEGPLKEIVFCPMLVLKNGFFKLRKVIFHAYPTMWGEFKNFVQIIRTTVIDKVVGSSIYALFNPFTGS